LRLYFWTSGRKWDMEEELYKQFNEPGIIRFIKEKRLE
jgi:hypothetical protein